MVYFSAFKTIKRISNLTTLFFSDLQALERLSFGRSRITDTLIAQSRILIFWYYTTYLLLEKNKPKYQQLEPPPLNEILSDLQIESFDIDNTDKTQPEEDLQIESVDNDNMEETQPEALPSLDQVESKDDGFETPPIDQIRPFILEGL